MKTRIHPLLFSLFCGAAMTFVGFPAQAAPEATVGQPAPNFSLQGADGKTHSLSEYAGKYVVLEWTNPECPFVKKFYNSDTMQNLQKEETAKGVAWLRINSGAPGHDGYQTIPELVSYVEDHHVAATESLVDPTGEVGHMYGARNTPEMFVIDPKGTLIYAGGIDNKPSTDPSDIASATNYVTAALQESMAGQPVATPTAPPYGCSVKYASN
jgi:peroxiredoxin